MIKKKILDSKVLRLEEVSFNSWPSLRSLQYDGWILRAANGFTDRCNSVWPLYGSNLKLEEKVLRCERFYSVQGQPAIFRIPSDKSREELDDYLEKLGYTVKTPTIVETRRISDSPVATMPDGVSVSSVLDDCWIDDVVDVMDFSRSMATYRQILANIVWPIGLFRARVDGNVIAVALAVAEEEFVGLYGMHTRLTFRRQGWGRKLMSAMMHWGQSQGAKLAYFHVEEDNTPARRLYDGLGFEEIYRYWYRVKPKP